MGLFPRLIFAVFNFVNGHQTREIRETKSTAKHKTYTVDLYTIATTYNAHVGPRMTALYGLLSALFPV